LVQEGRKCSIFQWGLTDTLSAIYTIFYAGLRFAGSQFAKLAGINRLVVLPGGLHANAENAVCLVCGALQYGQEAALEVFDRRATGRRHHLHRGNNFSVPVKQRNGDRAHALFEFLIAQSPAAFPMRLSSTATRSRRIKKVENRPPGSVTQANLFVRTM
jgi:hypothetical protein